MVGRMIRMEKHPGTHSDEIGDTWRRCFVKFIFAVERLEAKEACDTYQLCMGLEV